MTRFTFRGDVTWGSGAQPRSVAVMTENQAGFDTYVANLAPALNLATDLLDKTIANMESTSPKIGELAAHFFRTDAAFEWPDRVAVLAILVQTANGLRSHTLKFKVGEIDGSHGFVTTTKDQSATKSHHTVVASLKHGRLERVGAIHLDADLLLGDLDFCAQTIIHEATHKYAGTVDCCYFVRPDLTPDKPLDSKRRGLANADSHAWFAVLIGKAVAQNAL